MQILRRPLYCFKYFRTKYKLREMTGRKVCLLDHPSAFSQFTWSGPDVIPALKNSSAPPPSPSRTHTHTHLTSPPPHSWWKLIRSISKLVEETHLAPRAHILNNRGCSRATHFDAAKRDLLPLNVLPLDRCHNGVSALTVSRITTVRAKILYQ